MAWSNRKSDESVKSLIMFDETKEKRNTTDIT